MKPASWATSLSQGTIRIGAEVELVFTVQLEDNWVIYSNEQEYEPKKGPIAAKFNFEPNDGYELLGEVEPIGFQSKYDDIWEANVSFAENKVEFRQKIRVLSKSPVIKGIYEYQVCNLESGLCINGDDEFEFQIQTKD
ncbi:MAG: hypothetical protein AAGF96_05110 [Bacteroidota bacterium]